MAKPNEKIQMSALEYFSNLKRNYSIQRQPWENKWKQARAAYYMDDNLERVYEGRARIQVPITKWKVNGITARLNRILFNSNPIGRLVSSKIGDKINKNVIDLWNTYIFKKQIQDIGLVERFKQNNRDKVIMGTSVAKLIQRYETKKVTNNRGETEEVVVKDNPYYMPVLLEEFYSDVTKSDIEDSQACIHSTVVPFQSLKRQVKKSTTEVYELHDKQTGMFLGREEQNKEEGIYFNLHLLLLDDGFNITDEQREYMDFLGLSTTAQSVVQKELKESLKTGMVKIDECWGRFVMPNEDGVMEEQEVVCTIAQGKFIIRLERNPYMHKRYSRPFIIGTFEPISNCLYGLSNVIASHNLIQELNASRAQATDAKTRAITHMWYWDKSKDINWNGVWKPNGIVKGTGKLGLEPLLNPHLGNISIQDSVLIQKDLDQLWSLSPVQEGSSDRRHIPDTARGTAAVISQNDIPLDDLINHTTDKELKKVIEMIFERNLSFKTVDDLLQVWDEQVIAQSGISPEMEMEDLIFDFSIRILGTLEISNEISQQQGLISFIGIAKDIPTIANRLDWTAISQKLLASFGIKDDTEDIFLPEDVVQRAMEQEKQAKAQAAQAQRQQAIEDKQISTSIDTQADITKMVVEGEIEAQSDASIGSGSD